MAIPALHISLGTFLKFFVLLEDHCYQLDFKITAMTGDGNGLTEDQVKLVTSAYKEMKRTEEDISSVENTITLVHAAIAENIAKNVEREDEIKKVYEPRLIYLAKKVEEKVKLIPKIVKKNNLETVNQHCIICKRNLYFFFCIQSKKKLKN